MREWFAGVLLQAVWHLPRLYRVPPPAMSNLGARTPFGDGRVTAAEVTRSSSTSSRGTPRLLVVTSGVPDSGKQYSSVRTPPFGRPLIVSKHICPIGSSRYFKVRTSVPMRDALSCAVNLDMLKQTT
jgi:hypothetical protein